MKKKAFRSFRPVDPIRTHGERSPDATLRMTAMTTVRSALALAENGLAMADLSLTGVIDAATRTLARGEPDPAELKKIIDLATESRLAVARFRESLRLLQE